LLHEELIAEKRVLEPERGKIETYVRCKVNGGWFWVEGGHWEPHVKAYHEENKA
jgi:hypothetical protein